MWPLATISILCAAGATEPGPTMRKKLTAIGNSYGVVIEKPILDLLDIDKDTELEMSTDGKVLVLEPRRQRRKRIADAAHRVMSAHDSTFRKLAK